MTTATIICDGGLDLVSPRQDLAPGTARDMLNFERGNRSGYTESLGIKAFSGGSVHAVVDPIIIYDTLLGTGNVVGDTSGFQAGQIVYWGRGKFFTQIGSTSPSLSTYDGRARICIKGTVGSTTHYAGLAAIEGRVPVVGDSITDGVTTVTVARRLVRMSEFTFLTDTVSASVQRIDAADIGGSYNVTRNDYEVSSWGGFFPGAQNGYAPGGFFWRDRLHAIADLEEWSFTLGTAEPTAGDVLRVFWSGAAGAANTSYYACTIERVITESGSWAAGTAAGRIIFAPGFTTGTDIIPVITPTGCRNATTATNSPLSLGARITPTLAALFRENGPYAAEQWERMDLGKEVRFKQGSTYFPVLNRAIRDTAVEEETTSTAWLPAGTVAGAGWTNASNATGAANATVATFQTTAVPTSPLVLTNFGFTLPNNAIVSGIEVRITRRQTDATAGQTSIDHTVELVGIQGTSENKAKVGDWETTLTATTYGSTSDPWSVSLSAAVVNATEFGVRFRAVGSTGSSGAWTHAVDSVEVRLTYRDPSSKVYFHSPTSGVKAAEARAIWYYKEKGKWADGDAQGVLTIYDLTAPITEGMAIKDVNGGVLAYTASTDTKVYMASSGVCDANNSQYEFARGNFYANEKAEQVFGVSGGDLAFSWDGKYCIRIRTGLELSADKPRHVCMFGTQLALGFASGSVTLSDEGYPESFAGIAGGSSPVSDSDESFSGTANDFPTSDPVHGLMQLQEQTLGVFCRNSIQSLRGGGNSITQSTIASDSGIIEYCLVNAGIPIFLDFRGFGTIQATAAFGNFARGRLSDAVAPYLVPRLQEAQASLGLNRGPLRMEIVRAKNQVRVYFRDKEVLTMTFAGNGFDRPMFSRQKLPIVPTFVCSGVMTSGRDRVFCGTHGPAALNEYTNELIDQYRASVALDDNIYTGNYVYELEVGVTWDGVLPISRYLELNGGDVGSEAYLKRFDRMIVSGLKYGVAPFGANYGTDYNDIETGTPRPISPGSTTLAASKAFTEQSFSQSVSIGREGFALAIKFQADGNTAYGVGSDIVAPTTAKWRPATIQSVTLFFEKLRERR